MASSTVRDAEFRTALANVAVPSLQKPIRESLISISRDDLKQSDLNAAMKLSEQELYDLFKSGSDSDLAGIIKGSLFWKNVGNATPEQKESAERAIRVLHRIGNESSINAIRVGRFGIKIEPPAVPGSQEFGE